LHAVNPDVFFSSFLLILQYVGSKNTYIYWLVLKMQRLEDKNTSSYNKYLPLASYCCPTHKIATTVPKKYRPSHP